MPSTQRPLNWRPFGPEKLQWSREYLAKSKYAPPLNGTLKLVNNLGWFLFGGISPRQGIPSARHYSVCLTNSSQFPPQLFINLVVLPHSTLAELSIFIPIQWPMLGMPVSNSIMGTWPTHHVKILKRINFYNIFPKGLIKLITNIQPTEIYHLVFLIIFSIIS
jgi:hypothetical protein